MVITMAVKLTH